MNTPTQTVLPATCSKVSEFANHHFGEEREPKLIGRMFFGSSQEMEAPSLTPLNSI
jgi:hypothetical protein